MTTPDDARTGLLFLCLGNICRSPLAEGIFIHRATERGVIDPVRGDYAGNRSRQVGNPPDPRSVAVATKNGVRLPSRARQLAADDGRTFHLILAMDRQNARDAARDFAIPIERVRLMRSFDPTADPEAEVPDPYYGGDGGFDEVYDMLVRACDGLLDHLLADPEGRART